MRPATSWLCRHSFTSAMDTMEATGKPYFASISFWAVVTPPFPTSMRLSDTMSPRTSTSAAAFKMG